MRSGNAGPVKNILHDLLVIVQRLQKLSDNVQHAGQTNNRLVELPRADDERSGSNEYAVRSFVISVVECYIFGGEKEEEI